MKSAKNGRKRSGAPILTRLNAYLAAVFKKGTRRYKVDFDFLARTFGCSRRSVESAVAALRKGDRFAFVTRRAGRSYAVEVSDRNPCIKGVFSLPGKKKIQSNTAPGARDLKKISSRWDRTRKAPSRIRALAGWLARHELGKTHRSECRTVFRLSHALNFATDALHAGHGRADIVEAYRYALRAVDTDLAHLPREVRWEPSSLVKLARRRLADGLDVSRRVAIRRRALSVAPAVSSPVAVSEPAAPSMADFANQFDALCASLAA